MRAKDIILQMTNGGMDVFVHYIGEACHRKLFRNPFRSDSSPSCHIYYRDGKGGPGRFVLQDFGDSDWCGDCFHFVGRFFNLDTRNNFNKILHVINDELNLGVFGMNATCSHKPCVHTIQNSVVNAIISFTPAYQDFTSDENKFWESYGITSSVLQRYGVRSLSSCRFERNDGSCFTVRSTKSVPLFGYCFENIRNTGIKLYRPHAQNCRFLYGGILPKPYIFGWNQLSIAYKEMLYITGGEKDVLSLAARGLDALCLNSETAKLPLKELGSIASRYRYLVFVYDTDKTGEKESILRFREWEDYLCSEGHNNWMKPVRISLPLKGTKEEKDVSDFFRKGNDLCGFAHIVTEQVCRLNK